MNFREGQELTLKQIPAGLSEFNSFELVAGVRYDARQRELAERPRLVVLRFARWGTALVPVRRVRELGRSEPLRAAASAEVGFQPRRFKLPG